MATITNDRLYRLTGDAGDGGGGLPLPPVFQTILGELLDHGSRSVDDLVPPLEKAVPKPERVQVLYPEDGYAGLVQDALDQMEDQKLVSHDSGGWGVTKKVKLGKPITIVPAQGHRQRVTVTVYEKEERLRRSTQAIDQYELRSMYNALHNEYSFEVLVERPRSGVQTRHLQFHPLARITPLLPERDFMDIALDIKENGVKLPIILFEGQVLDGRHRVAMASALRVPLRVEEFIGDETEARNYVVSMNVMRRHLTVPQRVVIIQELILPQEEEAARQRQREGQRVGGEVHFRDRDALAQDCAKASTPEAPDPQTEPAPPKRQVRKATERAAQRSQGMVSARSMEIMEPVRQAPRTKNRIMTNEIKTAPQARRAALEEIGKGATAEVGGARPNSAFFHLGNALRDIKRANEAVSEGRVGKGTPDQVMGRVQELQAELGRMSEMLSARREGET